MRNYLSSTFITYSVEEKVRMVVILHFMFPFIVCLNFVWMNLLLRSRISFILLTLVFEGRLFFLMEITYYRRIFLEVITKKLINFTVLFIWFYLIRFHYQLFIKSCLIRYIYISYWINLILFLLILMKIPLIVQGYTHLKNSIFLSLVK